MKLLVVEDDVRIRQLIASILSPLAAEILECSDGVEALRAYEAHHPDVVLMDVAMPRMDGLAASAAILARDGAARIIIVTNYDDARLRDLARASGACGYVLKENLLDLPRLVARAAFDG
jgi:CheY-like chemotaxis protein